MGTGIRTGFLVLWPAACGLAEIASVLPEGASTPVGQAQADERPAPSELGNLIRNGSFETRDGGALPVNIDTLEPGRFELVGWEVVGQLVDWIGPTRWKASHAAHSLDLDGGIRQTVSTVPGDAYVLSFDLAGNVEVSPAEKRLRVLIDERGGEFTFDAAGRTSTDMGWVTCRLEFTARGDETVITFLNAEPNPQSSGVALDHVVLLPAASATPQEPREVILVRQIGSLLAEAKRLRSAGRDHDGERLEEQARVQRAELEQWLRKQFGEGSQD